MHSIAMLLVFICASIALVTLLFWVVSGIFSDDSDITDPKTVSDDPWNDMSNPLNPLSPLHPSQHFDEVI